MTDRDEKQKIINGKKFCEAMFGDIRKEKGIAKPVIEELKPIRTRQPRTSSEPSEAQILKAILQLLHRHPKVAKVWRENSGSFKQTYGDKTRYIRANTAHGMSDIMGILRDGRTLSIEVKSAKGIVHAHQHEFLNDIVKAGGVAFVARSVDDVIKKLEAL